MAERLFNELPTYIGAIKRRHSGKDPFVYGLIIASIDNDLLTTDSFVVFKQEGDTELRQLRLAAFEQGQRIASEINSIHEEDIAVIPFVLKSCPIGVALQTIQPKPTKAERDRMVTDRIIGFLNLHRSGDRAKENKMKFLSKTP